MSLYAFQMTPKLIAEIDQAHSLGVGISGVIYAGMPRGITWYALSSHTTGLPSSPQTVCACHAIATPMSEQASAVAVVALVVVPCNQGPDKQWCSSTHACFGVLASQPLAYLLTLVSHLDGEHHAERCSEIFKSASAINVSTTIRSALDSVATMLADVQIDNKA
ncbi:hypothetical protein EI94DRAFT_1703089 [Lactarius quietus]|nr:hypothetical protein EI94DRAFT_1703089 [Lactarius quietus]